MGVSRRRFRNGERGFGLNHTQSDRPGFGRSSDWHFQARDDRRDARGVGSLFSRRFGMLVCVDHFFPEAARSLALHGAQTICHPSDLVMEYAHANTITRAAENRVFWIMANRTGSEALGEKMLAFNGGSQIIAPDGKLLARAGPETEELLIVEIDPTQALDKKVTPRNDLFLDRRTDLYSV